MKIAYLAKSKLPSRDANSVHVMKMCAAFAALGHEVQLITPHFHKSDAQDLYKFYGVKKSFEICKIPFPRFKGKNLVYSWQAMRKALKTKPDIIFGRDVLGCCLASFFHPCVGLEHHSPISKKQFYFPLARWAFKWHSFKTLVVISAALKKLYKKDFSSITSKILVAHDGADDTTTAARQWPRTKRLQVGYIGHLYPGRGIDIILGMARSCEFADFHIIGGTEKDIAFWQPQIADLKNITLHGFLSPANAAAIRKKFHVLLAPYQRIVAVAGGSGNTVEWMSPLKVFEYMAAQRAIIASDLPVLHEVLKHNNNAILCPPDDILAWVKALKKLDNKRDLMKSIGQQAYQDFKDHYTWQGRAKDILKRFS